MNFNPAAIPMAIAMATTKASQALAIPAIYSPSKVSRIALVMGTPGTKTIIEPIIIRLWFPPCKTLDIPAVTTAIPILLITFEIKTFTLFPSIK